MEASEDVGETWMMILVTALAVSTFLGATLTIRHRRHLANLRGFQAKPVEKPGSDEDANAK